ncbi:class I SAM-dependent methyltransferase [Paludicola sp. MB14-C6]|uniref:class I SAM-dependent methyltransferase n=1 Tax=Paludihabitans sp. MB14-C6 TaxID=3070656 RepID=UPI0027DB647A|nr:class I SAM-dependent methyltransferase [Paludicola sp. MB14-C6]WMJ23829.1 class I SAM-dependent methyltransferase [Paludicola sp. MB14-C6]
MFNEEKVISKWIADMYDKDETETNDVEFALDIMGTQPKKILEIACGSGRILVPLAKAGHSVLGLDFDEYMLYKIGAKAIGLKNISYKKSDVILDEWDVNFDVVMLAGNFLFNIVSENSYDKAQELLFKKSAKSLEYGGHIYIDYGYTLSPENWFCFSEERIIWEGTDSDGTYGKMTLSDSTFDKETGMNEFVRKFELTLKDGTKIEQKINSKKHFATLDQIKNWLEKYGYCVENIYGDYNKNPISETTNRAIVWARKI